MGDLLGIQGAADAASKAVIKLIEVLQVGVGGVFAPVQRRRMARAEADAELILAKGKIAIEKLQAQGNHELEEYRRSLEVKALPAARSNPDDPVIEFVWEEVGEVQLVPVDPLLERARSRFEYQEAKRQLNVEQVAGHAFNALPPAESVSDEPVDPDWIGRFFDNVKDVSREDMQKLWGKLLAGEVAQPGRFSLRTLDVLRNLTSKEAQLFQRNCQFCSADGTIMLPPWDDPINYNRYIRLGTGAEALQRLNECGLVHAESPAIYTDFKVARIHFRGKSVLVQSPVPRTLGLAVYSFTNAGLELRSLHEHDTDDEFLQVFCEAFRSNGFNVDIEIHASHPRR